MSSDPVSAADKDRQSLIQTHLTILQAIVARMAINSAACKTWAITIVSAILVIVADKGKPQHALLALIPIFALFVLDVYYLALERQFRQLYTSFVRRLHRGMVKEDELFDLKPEGGIIWEMIPAIRSFSILPFYLMIVVLVYAAQRFVLVTPQTAP